VADDIVKRLSDPELCMCDESQCHICAAKAEIERLRAAGDGLVAALKDARAAMCGYAHQGTGTDPESPEWEDFCMSTWEGVPNDLAAVDAAITAWKEARRG
jgi:hypothetical protein